MAQPSTQPPTPAASAPAGSGSSILTRSKTRLSPSAATPSSRTPAKDNASKPNGSIKPTGRNRTYADPVLNSGRTVQARRDGLQTVFVPLTDGGDLSVGPVLQRPGNGVLTRDIIRQEIISRVKEGQPLPTIDQVRQTATSAGSIAAREQQFEATRQSYLSQGYMEGEIDKDRVIFIKTDNWCKFHMVLDDIKRAVRTDTVPFDRSPECCDRDNRFYPSDLIQGADLPRDRASESGDGEEGAPTSFERAAASLQDGDAPAAIKTLEGLLSVDPDDAEAVRLLGLALLRHGKVADGITRLYESYRTDPSLASSPMDPACLKGGVSDLRDIAQRVVTIANKSRDPDASIVAAALFQAQSKPDAARRMLDKAREKGLKSAVLTEFDLALGAGATK